jgi:hypothetical protein
LAAKSSTNAASNRAIVEKRMTPEHKWVSPDIDTSGFPFGILIYPENAAQPRMNTDLPRRARARRVDTDAKPLGEPAIHPPAWP